MGRFSRDQLLRLGLLAAAVAAAAGLMSVIYGRGGSSWEQAGVEGLGTAMPADILYRLGLDLPAADRSPRAANFAWWARQVAIAHYERLAYLPSPISAQARVKLSLIYGRDGSPAEAAVILGPVPRDAPALVRVSVMMNWLYGDGPKPPDLEGAVSDLRAYLEPWFVRACLADLAAKQGDKQEAGRIAADIGAAGVRFLAGLAVEAAAWALVLVAGAAALVWWLLRWLLTPRPLAPPRPAPLLKPWRPLDAMEVWAWLLLAVVLLRASGRVVAQRPGIPPLGIALLDAAAYLAAVLVALFVIRLRLRGQRGSAFAAVGLSPARPLGLAGGLVAYGAFVAGLAALAAGVGLAFRIPPLALVMAQAGQLRAVSDPLAAVVYGLVAVGIAPLAEEGIFRGFVYGGLRRRMSVPAAILLSSVMFAATHVGQPAAAMIGLAGLAMAFAYAFERTRNLYVAIGMHMAHNALIFALILLAVL
jgi:hypothetical protein